MTATTLSPREMKRLRKQGADYVSPSPYTVRAAFRRGDLFTKLSAVVFGLGDIVRKQYVKGIAMLALEIAYFVFMAINGVDYLSKLPTLGTNAGGKKLVDGFWVYTEPDRSVVILLYGVATLVITAAFIGLWVMSVRSAYKSQVLLEENGKAPSFMDDVRELLDAKAHVLLMFLPTLGIVVFTVLPLIFMISMAFTSYDHKHLVLFHWVGFENFAKVFSNSGGTVNAALFGRVLVWTLVWAFFATFLNFFFGMFVAMIINRKTTHFKGFWRACFSMSIAVPQFVSLLVMHTMLQPQGCGEPHAADVGVGLTARCRSSPTPPGPASPSSSSTCGLVFRTPSCRSPVFCRTFLPINTKRRRSMAQTGGRSSRRSPCRTSSSCSLRT